VSFAMKYIITNPTLCLMNYAALLTLHIEGLSGVRFMSDTNILLHVMMC